MVCSFLPWILASVEASRIQVHQQEVAEGNVSRQHPIPTPDGYDFNFDMVHRCYAEGNAVSMASAVAPPAGYRVNKGEKCPGKWIEKWSDGSYSGYGDKGYKNILKCATNCNKHSECAGFSTLKGACSYWRSGELQDLPGTVKRGYDCFVKWEVRDLTATTTVQVKKDFSDFQPGTVVPPKGKQVSDCLCVWDVDRTLTAKQGWHGKCEGSKDYPAITDYAYNGGTLVLSELAQNINNTFCGQCYFGVVSAGTASGPDSANRDVLDGLVDPKLNVGDWVDGCPIPVWGTKVLCCDEGHFKKQAVTDIVNWLGSNGIKIEDEKVHFFDDKKNNIDAMGAGEKPHYNAHMVSCGSRDGSRGGCGGRISEVVDTPGQQTC